MTTPSPSHELLPTGKYAIADIKQLYNDTDGTDQQNPQVHTPTSNVIVEAKPLMTTRHSSIFLDASATIEKANVPLQNNLKPFLLSLVVHILPSVATIAIVQLTFRNVFWFDNDPDTDRVHWKGLNLSLNELLNLLQFVAKIHEILLVGSLGAMVMHRVRNRLLGKRGLPFGMMTAGYSVGSAEYLLSSAFRAGFRRKFLTLTLLIMAFTVLANTFGPASAIILVPSLDWWPMKQPFGAQTLPLLFEFDEDYWWPLELTKNDTQLSPTELDVYPANLCFTSEGVDWTGCPAGGFNNFASWAEANANDAAQVSTPTFKLRPEVDTV